MSQQLINLGSAPNDGTGDSIREGGEKINENLTELYLLSVKWCTNVAMSSNDLATLTGATGSGVGGAIKKADAFYNTAASTSLTAPDGASLIPAGCWIIALQDNPTLIGHFSFVTSIL
jgi:hypothetical protein